MASDQDIAKGVETLLRHSDPSSVTTFNDVVQQLEAKLGIDLSHKAGFIRDQINLLLRPHPNQPPPPPPPPQQQQQTQFPSKDHFALHHHPQFASAHHPQQQFPSHFAHYPFHHDLNFSQPQQHPHQGSTPRGPLQQQPVKKSEALPRNAAVAAPEMPKQSAPPVAKRKGGPGGLNKVCGVSPELQVVVGEPALPRTEIVKQLWAYIRKNNLQDPSNKRKIICDDALRVVFETDCTDMFKMNKLLAKHIIRLEPTKESSQAKRVKVDPEPTTETTVPTQSPASSPVMISEALAKFLGVGGREMLQSEALQRVWEYIKSNRLEDPLNPMVIQCDENLRELIGCESISALGIPEILARHHLFKQS